MTLIRLTIYLLLISSAALLGQETYALDKAHSNINFEAEHVVVMPEVTDDDADNFITVGTTKGHFENYDIEFNPGNKQFQDAKLKVTINTNTLNTGNTPRDAHLKSEDFLDGVNFPTIVFQSDNFTMVAPEQLKVTGKLTMKGITKEVSFDVTVKGVSKKANGKTYMSFSASTVIDRLDFGLRWNDLLENGAFRVSNYIKISVQANMVEERPS